MNGAAPFRGSIPEPPVRAMRSHAPARALWLATIALVSAAGGAWTVIAKSLFADATIDMLIPTMVAIVVAACAVQSIRRARVVTPHRARTRIAIGLTALAVVIDAAAISMYVHATTHPPTPWVAPPSSEHHMNLCERETRSVYG